MAEAVKKGAAAISGDDASRDGAPDLHSSENGETNTHSNINSPCITPYVSAVSSPSFYSAPGTPLHFALSSSSPVNLTPSVSEASIPGSFQFQISSRFETTGPALPGVMSSADELFLNGQIRPMKLSTVPDLDKSEGEGKDVVGETKRFPERGDANRRDRSLRRRTKSMLPLRTSYNWHESDEEEQRTDNNISVKAFEALEKELNATESTETTPSMSTSSSRSSSSSQRSSRWRSLKDFLYRSKSEGRNSKEHKFWSSMLLSPAKDRKASTPRPLMPPEPVASGRDKLKQCVTQGRKKVGAGKASNGTGNRRKAPPSPHELIYTANRAQAVEMRKKTFLPYRQGLLALLGF